MVMSAPRPASSPGPNEDRPVPWNAPPTPTVRLRSTICGNAKRTRVIGVVFVIVMLSIRANLLIYSRGPSTVTWTGWAGRRFRLGQSLHARNVLNADPSEHGNHVERQYPNRHKGKACETSFTNAVAAQKISAVSTGSAPPRIANTSLP